VREDTFDIVLMDVQMPVLDGVQATKQIRALPPPKNAVPIIALTAHAMTGAREAYIAQGMSDYISKPLDPAALFAKLAALTDAQQTDAALEPSGATTPAVTDFDPAQLAVLETHMPSSDVAKLVDMFLYQLSKDLAEVRELMAQGDLDAVAQQAHKLAGIAANIGAVRVSQIARDIEAVCKAGQIEPVQALSTSFEEAAQVAAAACAGWLDKHPTAA
jgi:CheY-like chemotaxis protein